MVSARPGQRRPIPDRGCLSMPSICAPPPPRGATLQEGSTATRDTDEEEVGGRDGGTGKGRSWRTAHIPGTQHPQSGAWRDIFECRRGTAPASQCSIYTHGSRHTSTGRNGEQGGEGEGGGRAAASWRLPRTAPPAPRRALHPWSPVPTPPHALPRARTTHHHQPKKKKRSKKPRECAPLTRRCAAAAGRRGHQAARASGTAVRCRASAARPPWP